MKKRILALLTTVCMLTALLGGCASGEGGAVESDGADSAANAGGDTSGTANAASSGDTIKIGCVYPLTGDNAAIGTNIMRGLEFAFDEINEAGGINGQMVELIPGDTQGDQMVAMSVAERLITSEEVSLIIGCQASGISEVVSQVTERYQTPMISPISTADQLTTHGYEYYFRMAPTNSIYLRSMIEYLVDLDASPDHDVSVKTIDIISDNTLLGQETANWARYWAEEYGLEVGTVVEYTQGAADLTSEVLMLKSSGSDALVMDCYISDGILLNKTMVEQDYAPQILVGKGTAFVDPSFIPATGDIANGISTAMEWNPDLAKGQDINERFKAIYGIDMNGHAAEAFCCAWTIKTAIEMAGSADREALRDALEEIEIVGSFPDGPEIMLPYDTISFGNPEWEGNQHTHTNENDVVAVAQIQDGELKTVWPFAYAGTEVIIPAPFE